MSQPLCRGDVTPGGECCPPNLACSPSPCEDEALACWASAGGAAMATLADPLLPLGVPDALSDQADSSSCNNGDAEGLVPCC